MRVAEPVFFAGDLVTFDQVTEGTHHLFPGLVVRPKKCGVRIRYEVLCNDKQVWLFDAWHIKLLRRMTDE